MKKFVFFLLLYLQFFCTTTVSAVEIINPEDEYILVSERVSGSGTELIIPDDINWTQRFILTEMKELRTELERTRRELNIELNTRELASVDRALSYNANTVNFFWIIITIAVTGFGLLGWRTMKDVKENFSSKFEREVQKRVGVEKKKLETFMRKFENDQLKQSHEILKNQESIQKQQEAGYLWSQYNREEHQATKLELLDRISAIGLDEDTIFIFSEKSSIYAQLGLWEKSLEASDKGLEIAGDNTGLLYNKAWSHIMLDNQNEAVKELVHILGVNPGMKEEIFEDILFENILPELEEYLDNQETAHV
ncbi:hypothetical protein N9J72_01620 [Candidatus Gracilibacteria bacterium]|nr:hypothetical protein [Candidatus Gracilibacteria bacterium]